MVIVASAIAAMLVVGTALRGVRLASQSAFVTGDIYGDEGVVLRIDFVRALCVSHQPFRVMGPGCGQCNVQRFY